MRCQVRAGKSFGRRPSSLASASPTLSATASGSEHNLADTLAHVTPIGAKEMRTEAQPWVDAALFTGGLSPVAGDRAVFQAAIGGLLNATELSLVQLGEFCSEVVEAMSTSGLPIRDAVGYSLPRVGLPKDSGYFTNARTFDTARGPWQKAFAKLFDQRAPLLKKLRQNGQPHGAACDESSLAFVNVSQQLPNLSGLSDGGIVLWLPRS